MITLTELCEELNNWFDTKEDGTKDHYYGEFTITDGVIDFTENGIKKDIGIKQGQYFRIIGSMFNDGVYQYPPDGLENESFDGAIWLMRVPTRVVLLLDKINEWNDKYGPIIESPYNSESFGGYSYYKGYKNTGSYVSINWKSQFSSQIGKYRKLKNI